VDQSHTLVLAVLAGPAAGATLSFVDELRLGRADGAGGDLGGDRALSRHHAVIRVSPTGSTTIEDLGSANGTFVNGGRIHQVEPVRVGDTVEIGDSTLRVTAGAGETTDSATELRPGSQGAMPNRHEEGSPDPEETGWAPLDPPAPARSEPSPAWPTADPPAPPRSEQPPAWPAVDLPTPPRSERPSAWPTAVPFQGAWVGMVSGVRNRTEQHGGGSNSVQIQVLTFRLEQFTEGGDRSRVLSVELRGPEISGDVADGDRVEVRGRLKKGVLQARTVHNLTTGATVGDFGVAGRRILGAVAAVFFGGWVVFLILVAITNGFS
jgi:pSer/pThr/pTyr-binding forkhead associated (FHA) protein